MNQVRHFLSIEDLEEKEIRFLLQAASSLAQASHKNQTPKLLQGEIVVNLFFENSTRTRTSFEIAARRIGGSPINFVTTQSSIDKGETLVDTAKNISAMGASVVVVRHASAGAPALIARDCAGLSVINAGDGMHEHPSQALLDAYTLQDKLGDLRGKKIVILGDVTHSRVARSDIHLFSKLGAKVWICSPPTLTPPGVAAMGVKVSDRPEAVIRDADAVVCLRIQRERQEQSQLPSLAEYARYWSLSRARAEMLKPGAIVLHPGPINRGIEIDCDVAGGPRSVILRQVEAGVLIRMAILAWVCAPDALRSWVTGRGGKRERR